MIVRTTNTTGAIALPCSLNPIELSAVRSFSGTNGDGSGSEKGSIFIHRPANMDLCIKMRQIAKLIFLGALFMVLIENGENFRSTSDYYPSSLLECLDFLTKSLPRDHYLIRSSECRNTLTQNEVVSGASSETVNCYNIRWSMAISAVPLYVDEISERNCGSVGISLLTRLLEIEPKCDDDGIPLDDSESLLLDLSGQVIVRINDVAGSSRLLQQFTWSLLRNNEALIYSKYKLLGAIRSAFQQLERAIKESPTELVSSRSPHERIHQLSSSFSHILTKALVGKIANDSPHFMNKFLIPEVAETIICLCQASRDWDPAVDFCDTALNLVHGCEREVVVASVLKVLNADERVLLAANDDPCLQSKLFALVAN